MGLTISPNQNIIQVYEQPVIVEVSSGASIAPGGSGFPVGPAGGDLANSYPNPTVAGLKGVALPNLVSGYLNYNGSAWVFSMPVTALTNGSGTTASGSSINIGGVLTGSTVITGTNAFVLNNTTGASTTTLQLSPTSSFGSGIAAQLISVGSTINFTGSSAVWNMIKATPVINASTFGPTIYGVYYNPTITGTPLAHYAAIFNTGFVGIGTLTPSTNLHVVGTIKMVDGNQASGKVLTSDANGLSSWQNPTAGFSNPMTALGDMIEGGTGGTATRVPIGLNGYVWTSNGATASWVAPVGTGITGLTGDVTATGSGIVSASVTKILGNTIPANASGQLTNNGSGTLTWSTGTGITSVASTNGFSGAISSNVLTLSTTVVSAALIKSVSGALTAAVAGTDFQIPITLTTTGTSGVATFSAGTLNIPNYATGGTPTLTTSHIFVGNGSNVATDVAMSGDVSISSSGVTSVTKILGNTIPVNASGVLTNNGTGTLTWGAAGSGSPAGSTTQLQYNNAGSFGATSNLTFASQVLNLTGTQTIGTGNNGDPRISMFTEDRAGLAGAFNAGFRIFPASGTNVASSFGMSPKGTGGTATYKGAIGMFNVDFYSSIVTDWEGFIISTNGALGYNIGSYQSGSGSYRPITLDATNGVDHTTPTVNKQLYISTSGTIGINTTSPAFTLDVTAPNTGSIRAYNSTAVGAFSGGGVYVNSPLPSAADQRLGVLAFGSNRSGASSNVAYISGFSSSAHTTGTSEGGYMTFTTTPTGTVTGSERIRIGNDGNISIGTFATQNYSSGSKVALDIQSFDASAIRAYSSATAGAFSGAAMYLCSMLPTAADQRLGVFVFGSTNAGTATNSAYIQAFSSQAHTIGTSAGSYITFTTTPTSTNSGVERLRIGNDGKISATSAAAAPLILSISNTNASGYPSIQLTNDGGSVAQINKAGSTAGAYKIYGNNDLRFYNDGTNGNMAFLNDNTSGTIIFSAGGSATSQLTIGTTGAITASSLTGGATQMVVASSTGVLGVQAIPSGSGWLVTGATTITGNTSQTGSFTNTFGFTSNIFTQPAQSGAVPTALIITGGAHTALTAATEYTDVNINLSNTIQFATGALTTERLIRIQAATLGFVAASTVTTASTLSISGAPNGGTNSTITTSIGLNIEAPALTNVGTGYGSFHNAPTGATTNYALGTTGNSNFLGGVFVRPPAQSGTIGYGFFFQGANHTALTASTEIQDIYLGGTRTVQFATGALTLQRSVVLQGPSYAFVGASTLTDAATMGIINSPIAGTNATITNSHGLLISAGTLTGTVTNSYGLTANAQSGATNNYSAQFTGGLGVKINHVVAAQPGTTTIAGGTGAGTSPTITITGTDLAGYISVTTGTLPTLSAVVATITFATAYGAAPRCVLLTPASINSAALTGVSMVFVDQTGITTTTFAITAGGTALAAATVYKWFYTVIQ